MAAKKKKTEDKNLTYALIVLVLVVVLFLAIKKKQTDEKALLPSPQVVVNTYPAIGTNADLDRALIEVEKNDPGFIDKELSGLDTDSSNF